MSKPKLGAALVEPRDTSPWITPTDLARTLNRIRVYDQLKSYDLRTTLVYRALAQASALGLSAGIRFDKNPAPGDKAEDWPVVVIGLPQGEVAWHCKAYPKDWDGHTDEEKGKRIANYSLSVGFDDNESFASDDE